MSSLQQSSIEKDHPTTKCQVAYPLTNILNSDTLSYSRKLVIINIDRHCTAANSLASDSKIINHLLLLNHYSHLRTSWGHSILCNL